MDERCFFILTWLPTLLQARGASTAEVGLGGSLFSLGGLTSGLCLVFVIDRLGTIPMLLFCFAGAPLVAGIGVEGLPAVAHGAVMFLAGLCVAGNNMGMNATLGILYPTSVRSSGVGWAQAAGRLGAVAAPLVGGLLLTLRFAAPHLLLAPAAALLVGGAACLLLSWTCYRQFGGVRLGEFPVDP